MEPRAHHILIGFFTLLVAVSAVLSALWLSKTDSQNQMQEYIVVFNEAVRGLSPGSPVQYSGITVGSVSELLLDPEDPRKVLAHIRIRRNIPLRENTQAKLALAGISGASVLQLSGGSPDSPLLEPVDDQPPVIVAGRSPISLLLANSDDLLAGITRLVLSAQRVLSPENIRLLNETLRNIEGFSATLAQNDAELRQSIVNLAALSEQARVVASQASDILGKADQIMDKQAVHIADSAERALASLESSSLLLEEFMQDNAVALSTGVKGLRNLGPALQELRDTLGAVNAVARRLEANPANYLLGREKLQEYTP